ncbi:RNA-processing protein [Methanobrevibacter sp. 87.7]|uniref:KH domain-containing protein n=1 Tax=Methanobrevibacter sp. 87.7 TaxID=387957 RepID=UPI000B50EE78|nr:KH domain-containing protein [Methanobrevibacter sp. 87.7]OWT32978.1 RNA-processing protein [Methanobrevibacter sp. 87.7]
MPETDYLKIPRERVGVLIGKDGYTKKIIENTTETILDIDSEEGTVAIYPQENMKDPLGVWKTNYIIKAIGRGFNPKTALKLKEDEMYLEVLKLTDAVGKNKKALSRQKGRIIGRNGVTKDIITDMADVDMAVYGKTVSLIGRMENIMVAKEAINMILSGSRHKTIYSYLENQKRERKEREFKEVMGISHEKIELRDDLD